MRRHYKNYTEIIRLAIENDLDIVLPFTGGLDSTYSLLTILSCADEQGYTKPIKLIHFKGNIMPSGTKVETTHIPKMLELIESDFGKGRVNYVEELFKIRYTNHVDSGVGPKQSAMWISYIVSHAKANQIWIVSYVYGDDAPKYFKDIFGALDAFDERTKHVYFPLIYKKKREMILKLIKRNFMKYFEYMTICETGNTPHCNCHSCDFMRSELEAAINGHHVYPDERLTLIQLYERLYGSYGIPEYEKMILELSQKIYNIFKNGELDIDDEFKSIIKDIFIDTFKIRGCYEYAVNKLIVEYAQDIFKDVMISGDDLHERLKKRVLRAERHLYDISDHSDLYKNKHKGDEKNENN